MEMEQEQERQFPKINEKELKVRRNIENLHFKISEAIDTFCSENNYSITYMEINSALSKTLSSYVETELREGLLK